VDGTQSWLNPIMAMGESSTETTNRLRWYGTRPIMVYAFSKYVRTINNRQSKLNALLIGVGSTLVCLIWSNGVPARMMWLTSSGQWNILSHGLNSQIIGFGVVFNIEHWWASNEACTCSLSWSPVGSPASSIFWWSTPKYVVYPTLLKRRYTWHGWQLALTSKKKWLARQWLAIVFLEV
jgi:hypothetical protein